MGQPARKIDQPSENWDKAAKPVTSVRKSPPTIQLKPFQYKPGQSGNPSGRPTVQAKREEILVKFFALLDAIVPNDLAHRTYRQLLLDRILASEHLTAKLLDKLMPNLGPQGLNVYADMSGALEARLEQARRDRELQALPAPAPVIDTVPVRVTPGDSRPIQGAQQ